MFVKVTYAQIIEAVEVSNTNDQEEEELDDCDPDSNNYDECNCYPANCEDPQTQENCNKTCPDSQTLKNCTCVNKPNKNWYQDLDNDGYHSATKSYYKSPGTGWKTTTLGVDCDDTVFSAENKCDCPTTTDATGKTVYVKGSECAEKDPFKRENLTEGQNEALDDAIEDLKSRCLGKALFDLIDEVNVKIGTLSHGAVAQYNAPTNSIIFSADNVGDALGEELFHAFQQQEYGTLVDIGKSSSGHIGGSNIEFEEKAYTMLGGWIEYTKQVDEFFEENPSGIFVGNTPPIYEETESLSNWCQDIISNHNIDEAVNLSNDEFQSWLGALEVFQQYHFEANGCGNTDVYGCPIDNTLKPESLLKLYNKAKENNCI